MKAEFSLDAISKDGTTREVKKRGRTIKQLICVTTQHRIIHLLAFMLLKIKKEIQLKYNVEEKKQIFSEYHQKPIQGSLNEGANESKEQAKDLS